MVQIPKREIDKDDGQSEPQAGGYHHYRDQALLTRHIAHTVETADRCYDRSRQTQGRHAVLDQIHSRYRVS